VRLYVAGLTEVQIQQKIAEVLEANGLVSHPQVMVSVKDRKSKPIAVVGAVAHPMVYQADHPVTLIEILAEAGGIANDAGDTVIITRAEMVEGNAGSSVEPPEIGLQDTLPASDPGNVLSTPPPPEAKLNSNAGARNAGIGSSPTDNGPPGITSESGAIPPQKTSGDAEPLPNTITINLPELLERGDTQNNIPLQGGDVVTVPHAGVVYALGAVARPGGFVATNDRAQLSTLKVLALAGGLTPVAKKGDAVIIRKDSNGKQQEIAVDLGKIVKREAEDVRLMPSDILYVPPSGARAALIRASEIALAVATSVAIYRVSQH